MKWFILIMIPLWLSLAQGNAQKVVTFNTYGVGATISCGKYIDVVSSDQATKGVQLYGQIYKTETATESESYQSWISGFLSAWNMTRVVVDKPQMDTDYEGAKHWLLGHCQDNPTQTLFFAMIAFVQNGGNR